MSDAPRAPAKRGVADLSILSRFNPFAPRGDQAHGGGEVRERVQLSFTLDVERVNAGVERRGKARE